MASAPSDHGGAVGYRPTAHTAGRGANGADAGFRRGRRAFRRWRNTRPFWGGLLVILGGSVILLSERAPLPVIVHIGLQGLAGLLLPVILVLCGLLLWFNPAQRVFYSLLSVLLALGSWITSNLGGFFLGLLLGVIGGSLAFAWELRDGAGQQKDQSPDGQGHRGSQHPHRGSRVSWLRRRPENSAGLSLITGRPDAESSGQSAAAERPAPDPGTGPASTDDGGSRTQALLAVALVLLAMTGGPLPGQGTAVAKGSHYVAPSPPGATPATSQSAFTAGVATFSGLSYEGVSQIPTPGGGKTPMLKFAMTSVTLTGATIQFAVVAGAPVSISASSLGFTGGVVLFATKISGELNGTPVTFTPAQPPRAIPRALTLTNLVTDQPYLTAGALESALQGA